MKNQKTEDRIQKSEYDTRHVPCLASDFWLLTFSLMSTSISPLPIRLFCDLAAPANLFDLTRSQAPLFYRGDNIEIDIGIGTNGALLAPTIASSGAGGIASVTCQLFQEENDTNAPMMDCTVPAANMNLTLTQTNWNAGGSANTPRPIHISQ